MPQRKELEDFSLQTFNKFRENTSDTKLGVLHGMSQPIYSEVTPTSWEARFIFMQGFQSVFIISFSIQMGIDEPHFDFCEVSNMSERKQTNPDET